MIKVLAVDDEAPIRQWLKYCISHFPDFSCITAAGGQEGITLALMEKPDIILSDIEMPGVNGLEMIREINREIPDAYSIILTSHEDFDYARTALKQGTAEYMLKAELTEESLQQVLEKAKADLDKRRGAKGSASCERFLQALALHKDRGDVSMEELQRQGVPLKGGPIIALDFQYEKEENLRGTLQECFPVLEGILCFGLGVDHLLMVANVKRGVQNPEMQIYDVCRESLVPAVSSCCGISNVQPRPTKLWAAMESARYRCSLQFYEPHRSIFWKETSTDIFKEENSFQLEYIRALLEQNFAVAFRHMETMIGQARHAMPADIVTLKTLLSAAASSFFHFTKDDPVEADRLSSQVKAEISGAKTIDGIEAILKAAYAPQLELRATSQNMTAPVRQAVEYLETHYAEKVTLGDMAEMVAFSPEHFSRVFSRETGLNYITYLNNLRMKNAMLLLETTNMKVYEIAEKVGFSSLSYFSTAFKKKFGQNPYEYQVNCQRGKQRETNDGK